ncbi:MAG: hypothetical protein ABI977_17005 [Acidobacteriota bacterium]
MAHLWETAGNFAAESGFLLKAELSGISMHHTNLYVYESVLADDLKQAAVIVASFVYHAAMRDEKLPRKPLPKPQP